MSKQRVVSAEDFDFVLETYAGRIVIHIPVTQKIDNFTGEETLTEGTPRNIKAYVMRTSQSWNYKEAGLSEQGDAVMLSKYVDSVQKNDIISFHGESFRVKQRFDVPGVFDTDGTATEYAYTVCNLFLYKT